MKNNKTKVKIKNVIIDVDGVFTDGGYYYTAKGKVMKRFGPDDNDALTLIKDYVTIHAITGDKRGFQITKKRIQDDMGIQLSLVSTFERVAWIEKHYNLNETLYIGDGIFDVLVFQKVAYSIAPSNAFIKTKKAADFVTKAKGGEGAVAEACMYILKKFFNVSWNIEQMNVKGSGVWKK